MGGTDSHMTAHPSDGSVEASGRMTGQVLVVDDDALVCKLLEARLGKHGFRVAWTTSAETALQRLDADAVDAIVSDVSMTGMSGFELCERVAESHPDIPVVVMTAYGTLDTAIGAIRAGAYDFVTKPVEIDVLVVALERALQHRRLRTEVAQLRRTVDDVAGFGDLLGTSTPMKRLYEQLERTGISDAAVLIMGESGTGKELVARALHRGGRRRGGPFVAVDCTAGPETLLECDLFGQGGGFTDAEREGAFQRASGGTLFLDEIGDLPSSVQPKLLLALQERIARPLGTDRAVPFDVRLIASTNRDLEASVEEGQFREDLYFWLNVIRIELPPLRARGGDILLLAQRFLDHHAQHVGKSVMGMASEAAARLLSYPWPGNVRELQNCIERAVALTLDERIGVDDLPEAVRAYRRSQVLLGGDDPSQFGTLEELERRYIVQVMEAVGGHRTRAARILGLDRKTLYRKLGRYVAERRATS